MAPSAAGLAIANHKFDEGDKLCLDMATGALVHQNSDGTSAAVHGAAELYLAEFRDKVGKGALTYEDGWVEVMGK